ncbi:SusC/RagA family TonB-linked outer membrane protein [soil metagenome]
MKNLVLLFYQFPVKAVRRWLLIMLFLNFSYGNLWAQNRLVQGTITDETGVPLPGVNVLVQGTTLGTVSDLEGRYGINLSGENDVLVFSFIGFTSQEVKVGNRSVVNIQLVSDTRSLSEVVVTALGIEREQKALGYSVQEVSGEQLTTARETNVVNSLAGRVAGVQITGGSSGLGGSSRITIRGESSLNINANQPLFVVDGVPISNQIAGSSGRGNLEVDYGNAAGEINPDDIASISVLKGANATALYGSRAANGVILITTKSGKGTKGIGVSVNSNVTFERPLRLPQWQDKYGQGNNGQFSFEDGSGSGIADGVDESWGPLMDGRPIAQFDSPTDNGFRGGDVHVPNRGNIIPTPWAARPGNIDEFFNTGTTFTNNVAISGGNESGNFRLSLTNLQQEGMVPNTDLKRNTVDLSGGYNLTDKLRANASVSYIKVNSDNRPSISYGTESLMYLWIWYGRQLNTLNMRDYWQPGLEGVQQYNYNYNYHDNPYFTTYENTNGQSKDRIFGNISLSYDFTDNLKLMVRTGIDYYNDLRDRRRAFSTQRFPFGAYREETILFEERNTDFLLSYNKEINPNWSISLSAGGNQMRQTNNYLDVFAPQLSIPGIYNFGNSRVALQVSQFNQQKRINSLYGMAQAAYKNMIFLDVSGRNDWSSTLPLNNNSYFYPSVSLSAVVTDILSIPTSSPLSFAKLRLGWAQVGNDTDPYNLTNVYNYQVPYGTAQRVTESSVIANAELRPEISTSFEVGTDLRFFNNRVRLDATYYDIVSRDQILPITLPRTTGYTTRFINAGEIRNYGLELMLSGTPIQMANGFKWEVSVNYTRSRSEVLELAEGINSYTITSRNGAFVQARVGERMGSIYGRGILRVTDPNSQYFGQPIVSSTGTPLTGPDLLYQGNYNPDWMAGIQNTFSFKGLNLGVLFDIREGGIVNSMTKTIGSTSGQLLETLYGRENGYDLSLEGNGIIADGVIANGDGTYTPNTNVISSRNWHNRYYERPNVEVSKYDASYVKLREVRLGYTLPNTIMGRLPFRDVNLSLVGRNLLLWTENPHFDPETLGMSGGTLQPGVENMAYPSARSMGFNLSFKL